MHTYNLVYERLINIGFQEIQIDELNKFGVNSYIKEHVLVILQNWDQITNVDEIMLEAREIRDILIGVQHNVWNTYYLLCCNESISDETVYFVEREATALRKYLVRVESDLNRIPFVDNIQVNKIDNPLSLSDDVVEYGSVANLLISYIKEKNGENTKLNARSVEEAITTLMKE